MSRKLTNEPIRGFAEGDSITGFGLVTKKALRQDKNGRDYLDMEIADASGSITSKAWSDSPALAARFDVHDFVAYRGTVHRFRDQLQLNVRECRRVTEADREQGFEEALMIPSTPYDIDELDKRLRQIYAEEIDRPILRQLAEKALESYGEELREHPAAKTIHHAYRGGLLEHTVSMAELALRICDHYSELDRDLVLIGVLFHDLGKLQEIGAMPVNDYTTLGRLVGHVVIGRDLVRDCCATLEDFPTDLQIHLEHLVLSHQGRLEYGAPVQPMTPEALTLHFIDDLDSKLAQLRRGRELGESPQFFQGFGRYLFADFGSDKVASESSAATEEPQPATEPKSEPAETEPEPDQPTLDL
jgi:3'-5' exoribonuclease